jgi:hypothetical protein
VFDPKEPRKWGFVLQPEMIPDWVGVGGKPVAVGIGTKTAEVSFPRIEYVPVMEALVAAEDVTEVIVDVAFGFTPTQYEYPVQNPDPQSEETAGFHARNWAAVMPNAASTEAPA